MKTTRHLRLAVLATAALLGAHAVRAQDASLPLPPGVRDLPIGLSQEEEALQHLIGIDALVTAPPVGPVRASAEWDETIGVFCLWPNPDLFARLEQDNDLYIITTNQAWWQSWLASNGIPATKVHYLIEPTDTFWVRDYGPWFMWDGNLDFGLVDNIYNRPRPLDDVIPEAIAQTYGIPYYGMDLIHTGGNYYTDSYGNALSTTLPYSENPTKTKAQVNQLMHDYLGIERYITPTIPYDIQHMDTFGKLVAPDSLVWGQFPQDTTPWIYCEAALKNLSRLQSPWGWPYKIQRMPLWTFSSSWTGYINALQSGKNVFMASYGTANDDAAAAVFAAAAPGYAVVKVAASGTNWGDSVHCRTRNFIKGDAVRIYPQPHWEATDDDVLPYVVSAQVFTDNATGLAGNPAIFWTTTGGAPFAQAAMAPTGQPHEYSGAIPAQPHGTTVSYYIHAEDLAGRTRDWPFVAPDGLLTIHVAEDSTPPELQHDVVHGLTPAEWPRTLSCTATDDTGIPVVTLESRINGVAQVPVVMTQEPGAFVFTGTLPGAAQLGDLVAYRIVATDGATPPNSTASPTWGWNQFPITDSSDILVIELDQSPDSGAALVRACDDLGLNVQYTNAWPASLSNWDTLLICLGMSPTKTALSTAQANALTSFLNAGGTAWMEGGDCWAQDSAKGIYMPWFGIASAASGASLPATIAGVPGTLSQDMQFGYAGERNSSDHLTPTASATAILTASAQNKAVSFSTGTYSTVAFSFQTGGLVDRLAPSHFKYLTALCLDKLGAGIDLVVHNGDLDPLLLTFDLQGDPGASTLLFWAFGPGYAPLGNKGILRLDIGTLAPLTAGVLGPSGALRFDASVPNDPLLNGLEVYFQAYQQHLPSGQYSLTNRDRVTLEIP